MATVPGQFPELLHQRMDFGDLLHHGDLWLIGVVPVHALESSLSVWATTVTTDPLRRGRGGVVAVGVLASFVASRLLAAMLLHYEAAGELEVRILDHRRHGRGHRRQPDRHRQQDGGPADAGAAGLRVLGAGRSSRRWSACSSGIEPKPLTGTAYGLVYALGSAKPGPGAADRGAGRRTNSAGLTRHTADAGPGADRRRPGHPPDGDAIGTAIAGRRLHFRAGGPACAASAVVRIAVDAPRTASSSRL